MTQNKPQWFVSIFGSENELTLLRNFLDSPNCCLEQLEDKICYLTSCRFSNLKDAEEVRDSAQKLVVMIKAFAKLELVGDFQSVRIGCGKIVVDAKNVVSIIKRVDGSQSVWAYLTTPGATAAVPPAEARVSGAELVEPPAREKRIHDDYLNRCDEEIDSNIFDALYYFAEETSFYSLYKAYETIKADTDNHTYIDQNCKMVDFCWVCYDDLNAFKKSANCYGVSRSPEGKYSLRHSQAECRRGKKYKGAIFNLTQAEDFIKHLMEKWLSWKQQTITP